MSPRDIAYRAIHNINDDMGTAVTIQSMVFGNKGDDSATGVVFTRNPSTGCFAREKFSVNFLLMHKAKTSWQVLEPLFLY